MMMNSTYYQHTLGKKAEEAACQYLQKADLALIEKNFTCRYGEIDLIMKDEEIYVFTEIRLRNSQDFTNSLESITKAKQARIIKAATIYLLEKNLWNKTRCRFDVVGMIQKNNEFQFDWIKNAFW